jgi:hypothetical protein
MNVRILRSRPTCGLCGRRPALACVRGRWCVLPAHDVCRQCWRGIMDSTRIRRHEARYLRAGLTRAAA